MEIRLKEPLYLMSEGVEYVVRAGTVGVEKKRLLYFHDGTLQHAFACTRQFCLENTQLFSVKKTLNDREVPLSDVVNLAKTILPLEYAQSFINELHLV